VKYGLYGAVLAGLVGGSVAWSSVDKTVTLVVDGQPASVHTTASRVADVLKSRGYRVGAHDLVAPAPNATVHGGSTIVYNRGRLLHLDVDGVDRNIWTTAPTVADALAQLGYSSADFTSVSRSRRLPLTPTDITVRTPMLVTLVHDGRSQQVSTTDATVGELFDDLGLTAVGEDRVSVAVGSGLRDGERIVIQRVTHASLTRTTALPFATTRTPDSTMTQGQTRVITYGVNGVAKVTYAAVYLDGKLFGKTPVKTVVVTPPTTEVISVGTQPVVVAPPAPLPSPGSAEAIAEAMLAARGWGSDQFACLVQLWGHESGWRVNASNGSGAYGIPQALPGSKMADAGPNWQTDARTQITWGLSYITGRYGTPCGAWTSWQNQGGWY
jgi:uncharacterized protein YabE (DUF348 family)